MLKVVKSTNPSKKWTAIFRNDDGKEKKINFGAAGYGDYTITKNKEQRERYRKRHARDLLTEKNKKGLGAGALSYWILWGPSTSLKKNISEYRKRFNL